MAGDLAAARVKDAMNSMIENLDRSCLRGLQRDMHQCAANCCENLSFSTTDVQQCIESCSKDINNVQNILQNEISNFQDRIQRCVMQCQDNLRDKIPPTATEQDIIGYKNEFEQCVVKCADTHIDLLPTVEKRIIELIKRSCNVKSTNSY